GNAFSWAKAFTSSAPRTTSDRMKATELLMRKHPGIRRIVAVAIAVLAQRSINVRRCGLFLFSLRRELHSLYFFGAVGEIGGPFALPAAMVVDQFVFGADFVFGCFEGGGHLVDDVRIDLWDVVARIDFAYQRVVVFFDRLVDFIDLVVDGLQFFFLLLDLIVFALNRLVALLRLRIPVVPGLGRLF